MAEPAILGYPITTLFLYFVFYSFVGWCIETTFCCIVEKRFVPRGFLCGPICPIYGVGVLLMILFFSPFKNNLVAFYFIAMFVMTAWEYFVGWFLEITTHIKYWDYSDRPFNIKGRVCLSISLCWGVLSYIAIFFIHPAVAELLGSVVFWLRYTITGILFALIVVDTVATIRKLALVTKLMNRLQTTGDELRLQLALAKADLGDDLDEVGELVRQKLDEALVAAPPAMRERVEALRENYLELLEKTERQGRRFRNRYHTMSSSRYTLDDVRYAGNRLKAALGEAKRARKEEKRTAKSRGQR